MKNVVLILVFILAATSGMAQGCFDIVFEDAMTDYENGQYLSALEKLDKSAKCPDVNNNRLLLWRDLCRIKIENQLSNSIELLRGLVPDTVEVFYSYFYALAQNELAYCRFDEAAQYMRFTRLSLNLPGSWLGRMSREVANCDSMAVYNTRATNHYRNFEYEKAQQWYEEILKLKPNDPIIEKRIWFCQNPVFTKDNIIKIKGGTFTMGSSSGLDDETPHEVTLSDFEMYKYEISNAEYAEFLNIYGSDRVKTGQYKDEFMIAYGDWGIYKDEKIWKPQEDYEEKPAIRVSWFGANEFSKFWGGRLPSEAQWEYAARSGGKDVKYSWSNEEPTSKRKVANMADITYNKNGGGGDYERNYDDGVVVTATGDYYPPNDLGLYNMSGNVWEWCLDW